METVGPRAEAFYRSSFTPQERCGAEAGARSGLAGEWLYTFLWTVKEAALKSGTTAARGVWDLARMEVSMPVGWPGLVAAGCGSSLGERFVAFEVIVGEDDRGNTARIETTSTPEVVLTVFEATEASP
jgi:hypothetical protein